MVEIFTNDEQWFGLHMYRADAAKLFAKWIWSTGPVKGVRVTNKKDQISFSRGEMP